MKKKGVMLGMIILIELLLFCGAAGASNLTLNKTVVGAQEVKPGENITWLIKVTNSNDTTDYGVNVTEQVPEGCTIKNNLSSKGTFTDNVWNLTIDNDSYETLQINMSCSQVCGSQTVTNIANITAPELLLGDIASDYNASAEVVVNATKCEKITVRPVTLNLKSKGVLTVFFTINGKVSFIEEDEEAGDEDLTGVHIDTANSTLTCNGVEVKKILFSMKDGGTIIGKFQRQALSLEAADSTSSLNCEGNVHLSDERTIIINGNSSVKVIHADASPKTSLFQRILQFLGMSPADLKPGDTPSSGVTTIPTINPDDVKNLGQLKKLIQSQYLGNEKNVT
ncbi:MAG: DUF11 domain-containing protein, partial [Methanomicrobiales archaeon]|nr:DUF11 domain-containing protein [Methanomicrobiales archaeon]